MLDKCFCPLLPNIGIVRVEPEEMVELDPAPYLVGNVSPLVAFVSWQSQGSAQPASRRSSGVNWLYKSSGQRLFFGGHDMLARIDSNKKNNMVALW